MSDEPYRVALLDWMACAFGGAGERAALAARAAGDGLLERVAWLGTAGHVFDFDDTYLPGVAHLSAPTAPAAVVVGAARGARVGEVLDAYATGFEAMGALARASHPALYDGGWHPTAVCGSVGAAVAAGRLLGLEGDSLRSASRLALLQAGGMRAAFGSDGKALQVGMAAAAGVYVAGAAAAGASVSRDVVGDPAGFAEVFGGEWAEPDPGDPAIARNWIKPWPCCLMAHSSIHAAAQARGDGVPESIEVVVHPRARQAAAYDDVETGLQAKFSIPYLVAYTFLRGEPAPSAFNGIDEEVRALGHRVRVLPDGEMDEAAARVAGVEVAHSPGSPDSPLSSERLAAKVRSLAGDRLDGLLDDPGRPAADLLAVYE